jgi:hypothetical protein
VTHCWIGLVRDSDWREEDNSGGTRRCGKMVEAPSEPRVGCQRRRTAKEEEREHGRRTVSKATKRHRGEAEDEEGPCDPSRDRCTLMQPHARCCNGRDRITRPYALAKA